MNKKPTLVIGDYHAPWGHPGYLDFCIKVQREWGCKKEVINIGDEIDVHAISNHDADPDNPSPGYELQEARDQLKAWYAAFPETKVCIGNHTARFFRRAVKAGLPSEVIRDLRSILKAPRGWTWDTSYVIDNVLYTHGATCGGMAPINRAMQEGMSVAVGHSHTWGGVLYHINRRGDTLFGLNTGCGIDSKARAFAYAKDTPKQPTLGCGVVVSSTEAYFVPMAA